MKDGSRFSARIVSYLPLSHASAQVIDIYMSILVGATVYYAQPDALRGSLGETIKEVKPTLFFGVPRVWEKIQEKMEPMLKKINPSLIFDEKTKKVFQTQLGLDECDFQVTGAAPITLDTLNFFEKIGLRLFEVYGMSESAGPHCITTHEHYRVASVGKIESKHFFTKFLNKDENGSGELCMNGRHIMMGYLNNEEKTKETFDNDWLRTGDLATTDEDGFIFITGRLKELIITAGGENVAPIPIEDNIKSLMGGLIRNCMLVGDKRKFLTVVLCLKNKVNPLTMQMLDDLEDDCVAFLQSIGSNSTKASQIIDNQDKIVYDYIEKSLGEVNKLAVSRATNVQKFTILQFDFSIPNGELGPTLKLMRPQVCKIHADKIEAMYL
jgi:long-chain-fatty-acid--CoA ligase ACSBG